MRPPFLIAETAAAPGPSQGRLKLTTLSTYTTALVEEQDVFTGDAFGAPALVRLYDRDLLDPELSLSTEDLESLMEFPAWTQP